MLEPRVRLAINTLTVTLARLLANNKPSIYLYGSITAEDFHPGWSDIDLLVLTDEPIQPEQADTLVTLRQTLMQLDPDTPQYRLFEGGMLDLRSFLGDEATTVVYWGTTGQRVKKHHAFSAFDRASLLQNGQLLWGKDVRRHIENPTFAEVHAAMAQHLQVILEHAKGERSIYAYGWLLDIARSMYTLVNGKLTTKTAAAQWALDEQLCPCPEALSMALMVRRQPELIRDAAVLDYAEGLTEAIQSYALLLKEALGMHDMGRSKPRG